MRLFLLLIFFSAFHIARSQVTQASILQLEKNRFKAMTSRDSITLDRILADDLMYYHTDGAIDTKESLIRNVMSGNLEYISIDIQQINIHVFGKIAWIEGAANIKVRPAKNAGVLNLFIRYLDIYKREYGEWKMVAWQSARIQ